MKSCFNFHFGTWGAFHTKDVFNLFIAQDEVLGRLSAAASRKVLK